MIAESKIKSKIKEENGYYWLPCRIYGLPDNTQGGVGYHVVYRPLNPDYQHQMLPDHVLDAIRAFNEAKKPKDDKEAKKPKKETIKEPKYLCKLCETICYGDCEAN